MRPSRYLFTLLAIFVVLFGIVVIGAAAGRSATGSSPSSVWT